MKDQKDEKYSRPEVEKIYEHINSVISGVFTQKLKKTFRNKNKVFEKKSSIFLVTFGMCRNAYQRKYEKKRG